MEIVGIGHSLDANRGWIIPDNEGVQTLSRVISCPSNSDSAGSSSLQRELHVTTIKVDFELTKMV